MNPTFNMEEFLVKGMNPTFGVEEFLLLPQPFEVPAFQKEGYNVTTAVRNMVPNSVLINIFYTK